MNILDYIDYRHGKLWVTEEFLTEELPWAPWAVSVNTIRNGTRKFRKAQSDRWENHPHIKLGRKVLINWSTIDFETLHPFKTIGLLLPPWEGDREGGLQTLVNQIKTAKEADRQFAHASIIDDLDTQWMAYFRSTDEHYYQSKYKVNRAGGDTRANHLAQSVAILRLLHSGNLCGLDTKKDLQVAIAQRVKELDLYGKGLNSYDRLRKTQTEYKQALQNPDEDERDVVVSGHYGNQKRLKFDDTHWTAAMRYYFGMVHQQKPDKWAAWRDYSNFMIMEEGLSQDEIIQYSRFKQITLEKEVVDIAAKIRHGGPYYEAYVRPFVLRQKMQYSNTLTAGDGWEPGRSVDYRWFDPKKKRWVNRTGTMNVWLWYDWKSKAIISHNVAPFENSHQIRNSFRDIIGLHGSCPRAVMVDKKWAEQEDTSRMFEKADVMIAQKKAYSPKTNLAERNNKESNKIHRYLDEFWVNMTFNHSLQSQHNEEKIGGVKPMSEADFRAMVYKIIERYNHTPLESLNGRTPMEVYLSNMDPKCRAFDPLELTWIFGEKTITTVHNYGLKIKIASKEYEFLIRPEDMRTYQRASPKHDKVRVYYDERDMDSVDIYAFADKDDDNTDSYICTLTNADRVRVEPINLDDTPGHDQKLGWQKKRGDVLDDIIQEKVDYMDEIEETMGWNTASYMNASQEQYKEAHSNAVAKVYRNYHQDREEQEGHRVIREAPVKNKSKAAVIDEDEKFRIYQERAKQNPNP